MADPTKDDVLSSKIDDDAFPAGGQVSEGPSGLANAETAGGGADAVPDTPDDVPAPPLD